MHELAMCEGLVAAVERRASGRRVVKVGVRAGALLRVVPEALQQSFDLVAAGGLADGAATVLTVVPVEGSCADCGTTFSSRETVPACPECGAVLLDRDRGDELVLEWIEYGDDGG